MTARFADSFYYLAFFNPADRGHSLAIDLAEQWRGPIITTAWVLTEVADALSRPADRPLALELYQYHRDDSATLLLPPDPDLFDRGFNLFARRPDKNWSLTDCVSFVVMAERGLTDALTGDRHFEQAGFRALLRST